MLLMMDKLNVLHLPDCSYSFVCYIFEITARCTPENLICNADRILLIFANIFFLLIYSYIDPFQDGDFFNGKIVHTLFFK